MTVAQLRSMPRAEFTEWVALYRLEAREREQAEQKARRQAKARR